jgi:hypothetical protein
MLSRSLRRLSSKVAVVNKPEEALKVTQGIASVEKKYGKVGERFDLLQKVDNMLAKGQGRYAEKAETAVQNFFFNTVEVDG